MIHLQYEIHDEVTDDQVQAHHDDQADDEDEVEDDEADKTIILTIDKQIYKVYFKKTKKTDIRMGKKFECKRCGRCCMHSIPQFEEDEYLRVREIALKRGIVFKKLTHPDGDFYTPEKTYKNLIDVLMGKGKFIGKEPVLQCEFLEIDKNGKSSCTIYELRPIVCKIFGTNPNDIKKCCLNPENQ